MTTIPSFMSSTSAIAQDAASVRPKATVDAQRLPMFDAMRVLSALSVMWIHAPLFERPWGGTWKHIAGAMRFGVPFFTIAALILLTRSLAKRPDEKFSVYAKDRFVRLVPPLAVWSLIYLGYYWIMRSVGGGKAVAIGPGLALGGAAIHLWFLPFVIIACLIAFPILKLAQHRPQIKYWAVPILAVLSIGAIFLPSKFPPEKHTWIDAGALFFFEQSIYNLPTYLAGIAIAMVYPKRLTDRQSLLAMIVGLAIVIIASGLAYSGVSSSAIQLSKGIGISLCALSTWSPWMVQKLAWYGRLSFGVYLVHLIFVSLLRDVGGWYFPRGSFWFYPTITILAFITSYATALAANKVKWAKFLFP